MGDWDWANEAASKVYNASPIVIAEALRKARADALEEAIAAVEKQWPRSWPQVVECLYDLRDKP